MEFSEKKNNVKKIWSTKDGEALIANIARVSNPKNQSEGSNISYEGLLKYLIKNNHWSPFEMVNLCIEINTTRAISAQIIRHRSFSFQEFSQRYASVNELEEIQIPDFRRQDLKNRQNSIDDIELNIKKAFEESTQKLFKDILVLYENMLENGIAKECARNILPMCTPTRIYMNGNMRNWIHYLQLRRENGTQKEHALIAENIIQTIIKDEFPIIYKVCFEKNKN